MKNKFASRYFKKILKSTTAIAMAICVTASMGCFNQELLIAATAEEGTTEDAPASGECGETLTWSLSSDGTLSISGNGDMDNYTTELSDQAPWNGSRDNISSVIVGNGVTSIGDYAFIFCKNLQKVNLPEGLTKIGKFAFSQCESLDEVNLPETLKEIQMYAFNGCSSLKDITIPSDAKLGSWTFAGCGFTTIKLPDDTEQISEGLFSGCKELTEFTFPSGIKEIGGQAFNGCTKLKEIEIPDGVASIEGGTFSNCTSLEQIQIPSGVKEIGMLAFAECTSLKSVEIASGVRSIGASSFKGCIALEQIEIPFGVESIGDNAFKDCESLSRIKIASSITDIGWYAFGNCTNLKYAVIPAAVETIGKYAFGYTYETEYLPDEDFTIHGEKESTAETYAEDNGFIFKEISEFNEDGKPENHLEVLANGSRFSPNIKVEKNGTVELHVTVTADNMEGLQYRWGYLSDGHSGTKIPIDCTTDKCTINNVTKSYEYYCTVTDCYGNEESAYFTVGVENKLKVYANGENSNYYKMQVEIGGSANLYVEASADDDSVFSYRWSRYDDENGKRDLEYTESHIVVEDLQKHVKYYCRVTDCYGNEETAEFDLNIDNHLVIYANGNKSSNFKKYVKSGEKVTLTTTVEADNMQNLKYQWFYLTEESAIQIDNSTNEYVIDAVTDYKPYYCKVIDYYGNVSYAWYKIGIDNSLKVYANGSEESCELRIAKGKSVELHVDVTADDTSNLKYKWTYLSNGFSGKEIEVDCTASTYTVNNVEKSIEYWCTVIDCYGNEETAYFSVYVDNNLKVYPSGTTDIFKDLYVSKNEPFTLAVDVTADDMEGLIYEWYHTSADGQINDSIPVGEDTSVCQIDGLERYMTYRCHVTDRYGNSKNVLFFVYVNVDTITANDSGEDNLDIEVAKSEKVTLTAHSKKGNEAAYTYSWVYYDSESEDPIALSSETNVCIIENVQKDMRIVVTIEDPEYGNTYYLTYYIYVIDKPDHVHTLEFVEAKVATCKDAGNIEYWHCNDCNKKFKDKATTQELTVGEEIIAKNPANHIGETYVKGAVEATETTDGYTGDIYCAGCDSILAKGNMIPATGKNEPDDSNTDSGNTGGTTTGGSATGNTTTGGSAGGGAAVSGGSTGDVSTGASTSTDEKKDDSKVDKKVTTNKDGSVKEVVKEKETNSKGKDVTVTTTTEKDKKGKVTNVTEKAKIDNIASDASATVTVKTDKKGNVTATASVEKKVASEKKTTTISSSMIEQIKEAAGTDVDITMTVKDEKGNTKYKVKADTADLKKGKDLYIYKLNTKTGEYVMVNDKTYSVSDKGNISVKLDNKETYELVSATDAKKIDKKILATVQTKKTTASVKKGKKTSIALSNKLNMSNVAGITYSTDSKSVATVSKKGIVTAMGKGTTTIKATVTLKNGKTKTVKMKVTVK